MLRKINQCMVKKKLSRGYDRSLVSLNRYIKEVHFYNEEADPNGYAALHADYCVKSETFGVKISDFNPDPLYTIAYFINWQHSGLVRF